MADDPDKIDITAETPIGKLAAKGVRISDLIGLLTLVAVAGASAVIYRHDAGGTDRDAAMVNTMKDISQTSKEQVEEMRIQTCILMLDQAERKLEMRGEASQCARIVRGYRGQR